ncbi:MAG: 30S ribosomal protein S17 [Candidatus Aerophobetes bacterium]|nr:30S ribosomal protein S17 [Candidatus Aerophobetes bacterium]
MGRKIKGRVGEVVSDKMNKTVVVCIKHEFAHPLYGKIIRRERNVKVHNENDRCRKGDIVKIAETRPLSKDKHWRVVEVIKKGEIAG